MDKIIIYSIICAIILLAILINKPKSGKQYEISKKIRLLPFWIKYIGFGISIASIIMYWNTNESTVIHSLWQFGIAFGLIIVSLSKERNEDEMTMSIRLNSIFLAFFVGVLAHFIFLLLGILQGGDFDSANSLYGTTYILLMYVFYFHITKRRMRK